MIRYILVFIAVCLFACKTKQERAEALIAKAKRLYPIEDIRDTVYKIDTVLTYDTTVIVKKDSSEYSINLSSLIREKEVTIKDTLKSVKPFIIHEDSLVKVTAQYNRKTDSFDFKTEVKERGVRVIGKIPFKKIVITKKYWIKNPHHESWFDKFVWWSGLLIWSALGCYLIFKGFNIIGTK